MSQDFMTALAELKAHMDRRFEQIDARFEQIDVRFEQIDVRFEQIDVRFDGLDRKIDEKFEEAKLYATNLADDLRRNLQIVAEGVVGGNDKIDMLTGRFDGMERRFERLEVEVMALKRVG